MTWSDTDIFSGIARTEIYIEPFDPSRVQPASVDLTLGRQFMRFNDMIDMTVPWEPQHLWSDPITLPEGEHFLLQPGEFVLGTTTETISLSPRVCAEIWGKSSLGRCGLSVHVTAGFVDPGFSGQITLEFYNVSPVPIGLRAGMPVCQIVFNDVKTLPANGYSGKYQGQVGVTPSRYHQNYA